VRRSLFSFSSDSCYGSDATWQEIGRMCGYKSSCSRPGSHNTVPPSCIGKTGRKFGTRLKEDKTEVEVTTNKSFTRSQRLSSLSGQNKSALTDHASHGNHLINWPLSTILDSESDRSTRWIREVVHI